MLIWWEWNLGGGPAGQPNLCFLFSAHVEEERPGRADERVVLTSERLKRLLAVRKLDRLEERGLSPPPRKQSLPAPKHTATQDFGGVGGCFLHFGPVS